MSNISISYNQEIFKTELYFKGKLTLFLNGEKSDKEMIDVLNGYVLSGIDELEKEINSNNASLPELQKELKEVKELKQEIDSFFKLT